jgi:succinate dehydrogenase / fumarate reductase iron-sulfur subunit
MSNEHMTLHLKIWRQKDRNNKGRMVDYTVTDVDPDMSFLEMLDVLNESLVNKGEEQIEFDNDCREGICGMCSLVIGGTAHGPWRETATCQLHMREYKDGDTITIEPFRAKGFPVIKDLVVDRSAFDRIIAAGGYTSVNAGGAPDANAILIPKEKADLAMDAASCIGCGACVAACPNASASLFVAAKVSQFALLPQGQVERKRRAQRMIEQMDREGFGNCSNHGECEAVCPKKISISNIARMRREFFRSVLG